MQYSLVFTRTVIGAIGNVISIFLFASPTSTFMQIYKDKTVYEYMPDPYLATAMNCMLWIIYGLPFVHPKSLLLVSTDTIGLAIQLVFLTIFYRYADKQGRSKVLRWMAVEAIFIPTVALITIFCFHTTDTRTFFIGIPCVIFCIAMYAAPLTIVCKVIKTKSVKYMPFCLSLGNFANGVIWTIYASFPYDPWILIPNAFGAISGAAQLIIYVYYYKKYPPSNQEKDEMKKPNKPQVSSSNQEKDEIKKPNQPQVSSVVDKLPA